MNNLEKKDTRVMWGLALEYYLILFMSSATLVNITWVLILGAVRFGRRDMAIYYSFILYLLSVGYICLYLHYLRNALKSTDTLVRVVQNRFLFLLIFFGLIFSFTSIFLTIWTVEILLIEYPLLSFFISYSYIKYWQIKKKIKIIEDSEHTSNQPEIARIQLNPSLNKLSTGARLTIGYIVLITLISTTLFFLFILPPFETHTCKSTPQYELKCSYSDENDFVIEVERCVQGKSVHINYAYYNLRDPKSNWSTPWHNLKNTIGADWNFEATQLSYIDKDNDGTISQGDYMILRSEVNGGQASGGMHFQVSFELTGDALGHIYLSNEIRNGIPYPSTRWTIDLLDETTLSLDPHQSALSRTTVSENDHQKCRISFMNRGNESVNISIRISEDGRIIEERDSTLNESTTMFVNASFVSKLSNGSTTRTENHTVVIEVIDRDTNRTLLLTRTEYQVNRHVAPSGSFMVNEIIMVISLSIFISLVLQRNGRNVKFPGRKRTEHTSPTSDVQGDRMGKP